MAEFAIQNIHGKHIVEKYYNLKKVTSKILKAASRHNRFIVSKCISH